MVYHPSEVYNIDDVKLWHARPVSPTRTTEEDSRESREHTILESLIIPSPQEAAKSEPCAMCGDEFFAGFHREIPIKYEKCGHVFGSNVNSLPYDVVI